MRIPSTKLKQLWAENPDKMAHALAESLREFDYNLTDQYVKEQITKLYAGVEPHGVIAMFLSGWLTEGIGTE